MTTFGRTVFLDRKLKREHAAPPKDCNIGGTSEPRIEAILSNSPYDAAIIER